MLPVNDMMLFVDVVKYKSFTAAADKNEKTAAAVSKRISQLEASLGVKLLKRTTRTLALTEAGEILYRQCANIQSELGSVCEQVIDIHENPKGKIKISALQNFSNLILSDLLEKFLQQYSDVELEITLDGALGALPAIDEYDIAFRCGRLEDSSAISRLVLTHGYTVCASESYLKHHGTPKTLNDLEKHNCLDCHHGIQPAERIWTFFDGDEVYSIPVKTNVFTNNALFVKHLALSGVALIYAPTFIVANEINAGLLMPLLTQYKTITNSIYLIHPYANKNLPKRMRCFIDFIFENLTVPSIRIDKQNLDESE
ncbi:LysR family transcriptional regulator [Parashewanella spongiae]|uniref:LysR family transcriptional regulator n=1 Tax=Parashewanella spongiae TaxID=342950 RepID=A0A3A6U3W9_9GAMM|nr:LysR family transcriptional regulator [Parashewanella spongiae]MCL1078711.1 LysR family transcriptional regulator [Parashewanella spongiae]RJY12282.1 LysR family transcriptional regulator [Parashewanella spongiae]